LRAQRLAGAIDQRLLFGFTEFGGGVHRKIEPGRHVAFLHLPGDVFGVLLRMIPLGKIKVGAAAIHVSLDQPGDGRDVRIPGPRGLIAMAVKAGPVE
jgi:hypothetical protein